MIEDEADFVEFLKMRLEANGYEVVAAVDGKDGFEKARSEKPDLILLDLMLPKVDGYWVCNFLKHDTRFSSIPVIILTAKTGEASVKLAKDCGADEYMQKPFEVDDLLSKISGLLSSQ
jgi:DNA-binding response OmpR family regulator